MDKTKLIVGKRLWHGGQFFESGTPVSTVEEVVKTPLSDDDVKRYFGGGFLVDKDEAERARNAEAYDARQSAAAKDLTIQELRERIAQLELTGPSVGDDSTTGHDLTQVDQVQTDLSQAQEKISALETQLTAAQSGDSAEALKNLQAQLTQAQEERLAAIGDLDEQKRLVVEAQVGLDEVQEQLTEYQTAVGELLPEGLTANARKALIAKGYVGKVAISLLTDEQLDAVDGIADASIKTLRAWSPFAGTVPAEPGADADAPAGTGE